MVRFLLRLARGDAFFCADSQLFSPARRLAKDRQRAKRTLAKNLSHLEPVRVGKAESVAVCPDWIGMPKIATCGPWSVCLSRHVAVSIGSDLRVVGNRVRVDGTWHYTQWRVSRQRVWVNAGLAFAKMLLLAGAMWTGWKFSIALLGVLFAPFLRETQDWPSVLAYGAAALCLMSAERVLARIPKGLPRVWMTSKSARAPAMEHGDGGQRQAKFPEPDVCFPTRNG